MRTGRNYRDGWRLAAAVALFGAVAAASFAQSDSVREYTIDSAGTEIFWRVYKAGAFARFGHNHVIAVPSPEGRVLIGENIAASSFELNIPVGDLVIDDPDLRSRFGEDFASVPSAEDIAGTRGNMLGEAVLNAEAFPAIHVTGTRLSGTGSGQTVALSIEMLGRAVEITAPIDIEISADTVSASSDFRLSHEDLGMTPFSVMMGALQVAPEMDFTVRVRATRSD